jgi:prophage regulatory protein
MDAPVTLLHIADVCARTTLSRATIYQKLGTGDFPMPVKVSTNRVAWPEASVSEWINTRPVEACSAPRARGSRDTKSARSVAA